MSCVLGEVLDEWEGGCFYKDKLLAKAYSEALVHLLDAPEAVRADERVIPFLLVGYQAYLRVHGEGDRHSAVAYRMALAMVGGEYVAPPPRPATPLAETERGGGSADPPTPPPGSRPPSPSPRDAKRPREEEREGENEEEGPTIEVLETKERVLKRFNNIKFREEIMQIRGLGDTLPSEEVMESLFDTVLQRQREAVQAKDDDRVIVEIENSASADNPLWFSLRRADQLNGRVVLDKISRVLNSNQAFMAEGRLKLSYVHIPLPNQGGRNIDRVVNESTDQWLARKIAKKNIFSPDNTDNMCLTRSVAVAIAKQGMANRAFSRMKADNSKIQKKEALSLCEKANIDPTQPCGLDEVVKLQDSLPAYRLCVFTDKNAECLYKGPYGTGRKNIYILWHKEHFSAILYPLSAFDFHFECEKCVVFYNNKLDHKCEGYCWRCYGENAHDAPELIRCGSCHHQFAGPECMENHKSIKINNSKFTKCELFKFCNFCKKSYSTNGGRKHMCGSIYCRNCRENVEENHLCFMSHWGEKDKKKDHKYITIYWDTESTQNTPVEGKDEVYEHVPNLIVSHAVCDECIGIDQNEYFCTVCQTRQQVFHNLDDPKLNVMGQFIDYLQSFPAKTHLLLVAHNARSYDGPLILQELIARKLKVDPTLQGAKILSMKVGNWKFIDSLMFLPMPLSAMPKSFGLTEFKKGHWPHLANKPEYYKYEGPMLDKDLYCVTEMKTKASAEFHSWYDQQVAANYVFNFRRELLEYCISDVALLRMACRAFRKQFQEVAGFDPMFNCITLSSACMAAFRRNFLKPNTIGIVPPGGYHGRGKQSHIALKWLDYEAHKLGKKIKTIHTDREVRVMGRLVDGYVELPLPDGTVERRILNFHGCYWHNCPTHFPPTADSKENRYEKTQHITAMFREAGYKVVEMWECEFKRLLEFDPEVKEYFETHPTTRTPPLHLRDGLAGGRTSAIRSYHKADLSKGEKIKMVDVVSEYPNANLRGEYPVGHPEIYLEKSTDMPTPENWNGMIKCTVLPPRDLFLPVLPYKCNGKLMFPLCRTCAEIESTETCRHEPHERQLTGSWCAPELMLALEEKDYELVAIHELYQYPGTQKYNAETKEDGVLSAYVRCFMALKIQASGWPTDCESEEQKATYVAETLKYDGVVIDPTKMVKNPALRTLAKLMCNSFWGKFGEKTLRPKTHLIYDFGKLVDFMSSPAVTVRSLLPIGEECLQVTCMPVEDSEESLPTSSLIHASYTTCHGRLQLYKYLDVVRERALYHDTDSVAYISRPGEPELPLGTHLGDLTDQIEEDYGEGSFITEFVAGGPKNYSYKVAVGGDTNNIKVCIKVRGISINDSCDKIVTFENLKSMVWGERKSMTIPIPRQIARLPTWKIVTRATRKTWQAKNTKRRRIGLEKTVPHGFNEWPMADEEDQGLLEALAQLADA